MAADNYVGQIGQALVEQFRTGMAGAKEVAVFYDWVDDYWRQLFQAVTTSINSAVVDKCENSKCYSIEGVRHDKQPATPGVYINGNRKVLVK